MAIRKKAPRKALRKASRPPVRPKAPKAKPTHVRAGALTKRGRVATSKQSHLHRKERLDKELKRGESRGQRPKKRMLRRLTRR